MKKENYFDPNCSPLVSFHKKIDTIDQKLSDTKRMLKFYEKLAFIGIGYMLFDISIHLWKFIFYLI